MSREVALYLMKLILISILYIKAHLYHSLYNIKADPSLLYSLYCIKVVVWQHLIVYYSLVKTSFEKFCFVISKMLELRTSILNMKNTLMHMF